MLGRTPTNPVHVASRSERLAVTVAAGLAAATSRSGQRRALLAAGALAVTGWAGYATTGLNANAAALEQTRLQAAQASARYEQQLAAKAQVIQATRGDVDRLAAEAERRHQALALVLTELRDEPGAEHALAPGAITLASATPAERLLQVQAVQTAALDKADRFARTRAEQRRRAFKTVGVRPPQSATRAASGGPLIALPGRLDPAFAERFAKVAAVLQEMHVLDDAASALPFGKPAPDARLTSSYGVRIDPITSAPAFHSGQDFAGAYRSPVASTGAGVVSFTGSKSGYGNTVEVDHGSGHKTRYAHLATIAVRPGQQVAEGETLGGMGSTGRSTGVHLHYEVWVNGRAQNPARYLKAGQYVGRS
jgi:murein DD-endopeptidase MepM/ murein hydrolase activator NlpD